MECLFFPSSPFYSRFGQKIILHAHSKVALFSNISSKNTAINHPCVAWLSKNFATCFGFVSSETVLMSKLAKYIVGVAALPSLNDGFYSSCHSQCFCSTFVIITTANAGSLSPPVFRFPFLFVTKNHAWRARMSEQWPSTFWSFFSRQRPVWSGRHFFVFFALGDSIWHMKWFWKHFAMVYFSMGNCFIISITISSCGPLTLLLLIFALAWNTMSIMISAILPSSVKCCSSFFSKYLFCVISFDSMSVYTSSQCICFFCCHSSLSSVKCLFTCSSVNDFFFVLFFPGSKQQVFSPCFLVDRTPTNTTHAAQFQLVHKRGTHITRLAQGREKDGVHYDQIIDECKKKLSEDTGYWSDEMKKLFAFAPHWSLEKWISILSKGGGQKKKFQYCVNPNYSQKFLYLRAIQGHSGSTMNPALHYNVL